MLVGEEFNKQIGCNIFIIDTQKWISNCLHNLMVILMPIKFLNQKSNAIFDHLRTQMLELYD